MASDVDKNKIFQRMTSREGDSAFYNAHQVYAIFDNYTALIDSMHSQNGALKESLIASLEDLYNILIAQEDSFFSHFGVSRVTDIAAFNERAQEWANTHADRLLDNDFAYSIYNEIKIEIDTDQVLNGVQEIIDSGEYSELELDSSISDLVNNFFGINNKKGSFSSSKKLGLNKSLELVNNNGKLTIRQKEGATLSEGMKRKLAFYINESDDLRASISIIKSNIETIKTIIFKSLRAAITDQRALAAINYEFNNRSKDAYNFCYNYQVFRGWLGEVYWNAGLSYIFNKNGLSLPSGKILNNRGKQLSIDIILNQYGFQVKNWNTKEMQTTGSHSTTKKNKLGNFLETRTDLLGTMVGDIIADMFGALSYNKPTTDVLYQNEEYANYVGRYATAKDFVTRNNFLDLQEVFLTQLNKIIEIDNGNELKEPLNNQTKFYNTFWLIGKNVIPSSLIIKHLITKLRSISPNSLVDFTIDNLRDDSSAPVWPNTANFTRLAMANRWTLEYTTTFHLTDLLAEIIKEEG